MGLTRFWIVDEMDQALIDVLKVTGEKWAPEEYLNLRTYDGQPTHDSSLADCLSAAFGVCRSTSTYEIVLYKCKNVTLMAPWGKLGTVNLPEPKIVNVHLIANDCPASIFSNVKDKNECWLYEKSLMERTRNRGNITDDLTLLSDLQSINGKDVTFKLFIYGSSELTLKTLWDVTFIPNKPKVRVWVLNGQHRDLHIIKAWLQKKNEQVWLMTVGSAFVARNDREYIVVGDGLPMSQIGHIKPPVKANCSYMYRSLIGQVMVRYYEGEHPTISNDTFIEGSYSRRLEDISDKIRYHVASSDENIEAAYRNELIGILPTKMLEYRIKHHLKSPTPDNCKYVILIPFGNKVLAEGKVKILDLRHVNSLPNTEESALYHGIAYIDRTNKLYGCKVNITDYNIPLSTYLKGNN